MMQVRDAVTIKSDVYRQCPIEMLIEPYCMLFRMMSLFIDVDCVAHTLSDCDYFVSYSDRERYKRAIGYLTECLVENYNRPIVYIRDKTT